MVESGEDLWAEEFFTWSLLALWLVAFPSKNPMSNPFYRPYLHLPEGYDAFFGWLIYLILVICAYLGLG